MLIPAVIAFLSVCGLGLIVFSLVVLAEWMSDQCWPLFVVVFVGAIFPFATVISFLVYFVGPPPH